jgi:sec-independent protein translocase protein TatC
MAKSQDLFDDSTMSFGEHLEVLRVHLWKAIIGLVICVIVTLFLGNHIVAIVRGPIDRALQAFGIGAEDDIGGFDFIEWLQGVFVAGSDEAGGITDIGLQYLQALENLRQLGLETAAVTPKGLRAFKKSHPQIELNVDPMTVAGLAELKGRGVHCELNDNYDVVSLSLRGSELTAADLPLVAKLTTLRRLDLQGLDIDDEALEILAPLTALEYLNLSGTGITGAGLKSLTSFPALKRLELRKTLLTDKDLQHVSALSSVEHLDVRGAPITNEGLKHLKEMKQLRALFVSGREITNEGLVHLKGLTGLKELEFRNTSITDAGLEHLKTLSSLEVLNFTEGSPAAESFSESLSQTSMEEYTIDVRLRVSRLAKLLHAANPQAYPAPAEEFEDRWVTLPLSAAEFREFRETVVNLRKPVTLNVQEAFVTYLKVAFISGLLLASPWVFYQLWLFVAAGLYPHEQKYVYVYLPMSLTLFLGGVVFCFFAVFPFVLHFLLSFNAWLGVQPQIRLSEWISFAIILPLMFGISFQLPMVMLFLERISIFDAVTYRQKRRMAVLVIAILSMFLTPADPMSMLLMMFPLIVLYELGIILCAYSPVKSPFEAETA